MDGLTLGIGMGENGSTQDLQTVYAKYTQGSVTVGYQISEVDNTGATADEESTHIAASIAVNENLSISAGRFEVDMGAGKVCLLYTSPSPRDMRRSRMPSSA